MSSRSFVSQPGRDSLKPCGVIECSDGPSRERLCKLNHQGGVPITLHTSPCRVALSMPRTFSDRLAERAEDRRSIPQPPPVSPPPILENITTSKIVRTIRAALDAVVEPAIALLRRQEEDKNEETCFASSAGVHLRYRCCVYFTALAAGLLEQQFTSPGTSIRVSLDGAMALPSPNASAAYGAMARWLLQPPVGAPSASHALAASLMAEAAADGAAYDLQKLRKAAGRLPGPVGRYAAPLTVLGVHGTLWRCEVSTVHTYLIFATAMEDILIDVTYKQFLLIPEWLEERHFSALQSADYFSELPDAFVGNDTELDKLLTLPALRHALEVAYGEGAEDELQRRQANSDGLDHMQALIRNGVFALQDPLRRRQELCGRPQQ